MTLKPEDYRERRVKAGDWEVNLTSYKLGPEYHCTADNVSPGAWLARASAATREEAEQKALSRAEQLLSRTRRAGRPEAENGKSDSRHPEGGAGV